MHRALASSVTLVLAHSLGCSDPLTHGSTTGTGGAISSSGSTDASSSSGDPGPNELPCDVRAVLEVSCVACHSSPVTSDAPMPLTTRYDFLAEYDMSGQSVGARSVARMERAKAPMPPLSEPPAPSDALVTISAWVNAGMPAGTCGAIAAAPYPTTCASGVHWDSNATPTALMTPGQACRNCHKVNAQTFNYFFMGTVFPSYHEEDDCSSPPPADAKVEILDEDGNVTMTLFPNAAGNFLSNAVVPGVPLPYTARLVANGLTRAMVNPRDDGDCNLCHTEQGDEDAPGRLVWPTPPN